MLTDILGVYGAILSSVALYLTLRNKKPVWTILAINSNISIQSSEDLDLAISIYNRDTKPIFIQGFTLEYRKGKRYYKYDLRIYNKKQELLSISNGTILGYEPIICIQPYNYEKLQFTFNNLKDDGSRKSKFYEKREFQLIINTIDKKTYTI